MLKTLKDFDVKNKRVLVRCDFNVPFDEKGNISDDFRITQTIPTINYLIENGAKIILMSHLGEPEAGFNPKLSLRPVAIYLEGLLENKVVFFDDCVGESVKQGINGMKEGDVCLLENLRFHKEEKKNEEGFAKELAELADIYVNDAFGACHRAHASIAGVAKLLPSCAGLLLEKEVTVLSKILENPERPLVAIIGGAKVETKVKLIEKFLECCDSILLGGLLAKKLIKDAPQLLKNSNAKKIYFPVDVIAGAEGEAKSMKKFSDIQEGEQIPDIGSETKKLFRDKIMGAKTVFWNGPVGLVEKEEFKSGTEELVTAIIGSGAFSTVGGGETVDFINELGLQKQFSHVSTGGGAMMSFLSGEEMPGIDILQK